MNTARKNDKANGFLIDMDGVIYHGDTLVPGAIEFIETLQRYDLPFIFLTNNSQRTCYDIARKLKRMGMNGIEEAHVFTCSIATAKFISAQKEHATAFVIGEGGLLSALSQYGVAITDKDPDYVIVGEGRTVNFEILELATRHIMAGAKLIATNLDPSCPTVAGIRPGAGAIVALLEKATGRKALGLGKPSPLIMRMARKHLGLSTDQVTMIGDTLETDILGGMQMGYTTVLVLTGGTQAEDLLHVAYTPDFVVESVGTLCKYITPDGHIIKPPVVDHMLVEAHA